MAISDVIFGSRFLCRKKGYTNSKLKVIVEYTKYGSQLKKPPGDRYCLLSISNRNENGANRFTVRMSEALHEEACHFPWFGGCVGNAITIRTQCCDPNGSFSEIYFLLDCYAG